MIDIKGISKSYQMGDVTVCALVDVSLHVEAGEFVAVIGPSGSGKSTLMNMIGCLDVPDTGEYFLEGKNVAHCTERELSDIRSRKIGFIFQQFNLLDKLTAYENVELPLIYQRVGAQERRARAEAALERVGLAARARHLPTQLSGGQQQRVAIARALVSDPALILADEPTGNLDSRAGGEIMELLTSLNQSGKTVVLITHDAGVAAKAKRQVTVRDGRLGEDMHAG